MIVDITTAVPPYTVNQQKAAFELKKRMGPDHPAAGRLIDMAAAHSGIDKRHIVIPDADDTSKEKFYSADGVPHSPDTKRRMDKYEHWAKYLGRNAVSEIFKRNNVSPSDINRLITISCTGFFAPGLDYYLMQEFNIPLNVKRTNIGFMGCAASIIGFNSAFEAMNAAGNGLKTLLISLEICSLHIQMEPTRDNILANMIFADGCSAVLLSNLSDTNLTPRLNILRTESVLFNNSAEYMGWKIGNTGFEMILSSELPKIILNEAAPALLNILRGIGVTQKEIKYWALHPGGRAILDSLQKGLGLTDEQMLPSRTVLKYYGNMSSASILFVLKEIIDNYKLGNEDYLCAAAFGPGLTMEIALLKGI